MSAFIAANQINCEAASEGFDWDNPTQAFEKVHEEFLEVREAFEAHPFDHAHLSEEIGDLLMAITSFCRHMNIDPEAELTKGAAKFSKGYAFFKEAALQENFDFKNAAAPEKSAFWKRVKKGNVE